MEFFKLIILLLALMTDGSNKQIYTEDIVDRIEVNHFYNDAGQVQLEQIIFWDWSPSQSEYVVRAWRSIKEDRVKSMMPYRTKFGYEIIWHDNRDGNVLRRIRSKSLIETHTMYDPETINQELLDRNSRRELTQKPQVEKKNK